MLSLQSFEVMHPYSEKIISGEKTIETRDFPLPEKYNEVPIVLLESQPGQDLSTGSGLKQLGLIRFVESFKYETREQWLEDCAQHCVSPDNERFGFSVGEPKYGWRIEVIQRWLDVRMEDAAPDGVYESFYELTGSSS